MLLSEVISDQNFDFLCLTETWHKQNDWFWLNQLAISGNGLLEKAHASGRGGGLAVVYRLAYNVVLPAFITFECLAFKLVSAVPVVAVLVYRPPKHNTSFLNELSDLLTFLRSNHDRILLSGEFNIHVDSQSCSLSRELLSLLDCLGFTQHVNAPSHNRGHILDLVITTSLSVNLLALDLTISDHLAVLFNLDLPVPAVKVKHTVKFRSVNSINPIIFADSFFSTPLHDDQTRVLADMVESYNTNLCNVLDILAPEKTRLVSYTHYSPWYNDQLHFMKTGGRRLEHRWRDNGLTVHFEIWREHKTVYRNALNSARSLFYSNLIREGSANPWHLFSTINCMLQPKHVAVSTGSREQCDRFLDYFLTNR